MMMTDPNTDTQHDRRQPRIRRRRGLTIVLVMLGAALVVALIAALGLWNSLRDHTLNRTDLHALRQDPMATWRPAPGIEPDWSMEQNTHSDWKVPYNPAELAASFEVPGNDLGKVYQEAVAAATAAGWRLRADGASVYPDGSITSLERPADHPTCPRCGLTISMRTGEPVGTRSADEESEPAELIVWLTWGWNP